MKKTLLSLLFAAASVASFAQTNAILQMQNGVLDKAKTEIDKFMLDEKNAVKAKSWLAKAQIYEALALDNTGMFNKLDSMAAITAYESYKKTIELDTKEGKEGKTAKEARDGMAGQKLYSALMTQGAAKYQNKNFKDAYKLMSLASQVNPKDTTAMLYAGIVAQLGNESDAALGYFEKFLSSGGKDPGIYYTVADIYQKKGDMTKAMATLDKAIEINPDNKDLKAEKTNMLLRSGKTEEAIETLKAAVQKEPSNIQNLIILGTLYDNSAQQTSDEIKKLEDSLPHTADTEKKLAGEKSKAEAFGEEIKRLNDKLKKDPKTAAATKKQLADVTQMQNDAKANITKLETELAAAKSGDIPATQKKIAELGPKLNERRTAALDYYSKVLKLDPANFDVNFNVGVFHFNDAVNIKKKVDNMDMAVYQKEGKAVEQLFVAKFKEAANFFEKAWEVKKESDLKENLRNVYNILKAVEKSTAYDDKLASLDK